MSSKPDPSLFAARNISRGSQLIELFENALIYTTVLRNVDNLIQDKDDSIIIIIVSMAIASFILILIENWFIKISYKYKVKSIPSSATQKEKSLMQEERWLSSLIQLIEFLLQTAGNLVVQLTSSLSATLAISVFSSADSIAWGLTGALVSLSLLWMIQQIVKRQI